MKSMSGLPQFMSIFVTSPVWAEDDCVLRMWILLHMLADREGIIREDVSFLSRLAQMTHSECVKALELLSKPYPPSNRMMPLIEAGQPGQWRIRDYERIVAQFADCQRREYKTRKQTEYRKKAK